MKIKLKKREARYLDDLLWVERGKIEEPSRLNKKRLKLILKIHHRLALAT